MTKEEAKAEIENAVYKAALCCEEWEHQGVIRGSGHHLAQEIARYAAQLVEERWVDSGSL